MQTLRALGDVLGRRGDQSRARERGEGGRVDFIKANRLAMARGYWDQELNASFSKLEI